MTIDRRNEALLTTYATLKTQFENGAGEFHRLCHLLSEAQMNNEADSRVRSLGPS